MSSGRRKGWLGWKHRFFTVDIVCTFWIFNYVNVLPSQKINESLKAKNLRFCILIPALPLATYPSHTIIHTFYKPTPYIPALCKICRALTWTQSPFPQTAYNLVKEISKWPNTRYSVADIDKSAQKKKGVGGMEVQERLLEGDDVRTGTIVN